MKSTTGRQRCTTSPSRLLLASAFLPNPTPCSVYPVCAPRPANLAARLMTTGLHKSSVAYTSTGQRRFNQPFQGTDYGPEFVQGDVVGVGYRPRTGSIFFTRNGKKLEDVAHGLKSQNFFPTVGANGPCTVHVNFGQSGFCFHRGKCQEVGPCAYER